MAGFIRFAVLLDFAPEGWARSKVKRVSIFQRFSCGKRFSFAQKLKNILDSSNNHCWYMTNRPTFKFIN